MRYRLRTNGGLLHFRRLLPNTNKELYWLGACSLPETVAALLKRYGREAVVTQVIDPRFLGGSGRQYIGSTWCCEQLTGAGWRPILEPHFA